MNTETSANPVRISRGVYRVGSFVMFVRDDGRWQMAEPLDWNDPIGGGFKAGTVSINATLRACGQRIPRLGGAQ
jgi:hypothetical protein